MSSWQLLEERIDDDYVSNPGVNSHVQYIWGAIYIDDIVLRRLDANADGDFEDVGDEYWYHLTDPQFSTVAILNGSATVVERVTYDAFGEARHHPSKDVDGDGDYDATDYSTIQTISISLNNKIGQADYRSEADLDRDGDVDTTDVTLAGTNYVAALAKGDLSDPAVDNIVGWSGYLFDREIGLYCVRFRYFDVDLMRWVNRDPAGYVDSMNLYGYGVANPIFGTDPTGLGLRKAWRRYRYYFKEGWRYVSGDHPRMNRVRGGAKALLGVGMMAGGVLTAPTIVGIAGIPIGFDLYITGLEQAFTGEIVDTYLSRLFILAFGPRYGPWVELGIDLFFGGRAFWKFFGGPRLATHVDDVVDIPRKLGDWEWRGPGVPGSKKGSWYNPKTKESLHPDLDNPIHGPHYDYKCRDTPGGRRFYPDGRNEPKGPLRRGIE